MDVGRLNGKGLPGNKLVGPSLALLAGPLLALVIATSIFAVFEVLYAILRGDDMEPSRFVFESDQQAHNLINWTAHALSVVAVMLCSAAVVVVGSWIGARLPYGQRVVMISHGQALL